MISAPASSSSAVPDGLDRSLSADRHERRCLDDAMRRLDIRRDALRRRSLSRVKRNSRTLRCRFRVKKLRVGVIYGGRSGEHEVSVASAASIFNTSIASGTRPCRSASRRAASGFWAAEFPRCSPPPPWSNGARTEALQSSSPRPPSPRPARCRVPGAARSLRRGRHRAGAARAGEHPVCRGRRARLGRRHGQGRDEDAVCGARPADRPASHCAAARMARATGVDCRSGGS